MMKCDDPTECSPTEFSKVHSSLLGAELTKATLSSQKRRSPPITARHFHSETTSTGIKGLNICTKKQSSVGERDRIDKSINGM